MEVLHLTDLHLDVNKNFDYKKLISEKISEIVVLSGDIHRGLGALGVITHLLELGYIVIYVPGNNDYHGHDIQELDSRWRDISMNTQNFYYLSNSSVVIDEVLYIGSTLWTDGGQSNKGMPIDYFDKIILRKSGDFSNIYNFNPDKMRDLHFESIEFIEKEIASKGSNEVVIITHHLPSYLSVAPRFLKQRSTIMYASHLDQRILSWAPSLYLHGHTHDACEYYIKNTKISCKPLGYRFKDNGTFMLSKHLTSIPK